MVNDTKMFHHFLVYFNLIIYFPYKINKNILVAVAQKYLHSWKISNKNMRNNTENVKDIKWE